MPSAPTFPAVGSRPHTPAVPGSAFTRTVRGHAVRASGVPPDRGSVTPGARFVDAVSGSIRPSDWTPIRHSAVSSTPTVAIEWLRCTPQAYVLRNKKLCSTFTLDNSTGGTGPGWADTVASSPAPYPVLRVVAWPCPPVAWARSGDAPCQRGKHVPRCPPRENPDDRTDRRTLPDQFPLYKRVGRCSST